MKVAVIGAGAAGLVSARELVKEGHEVHIFEQSSQVGGTWVYDTSVEDDLLGIYSEKPIHSSLYDSLRTNLPRDLMAFMDYPFDSQGGGDDDWERYPHHTCVLEYLKSFARDFNIHSLIRFDQQVTQVQQSGRQQWKVKTLSGMSDDFDAISVCNGHYSMPYVPEIVGASHFKGTFLHSHNYRNPDPFKGQSVAILGAASSGADISREVATTAKRVIWCGENFGAPTQQPEQGLTKYSLPSGFDSHGELIFKDAPSVALDSFIFCTGYRYEFPFLDKSLVDVTNNQVRPLYMDIVHPALPTLGFIGLPYVVIPFPLFEVQARWFARLLSDTFQLPGETEMRGNLEDRNTRLIQTNDKARHFHKMGEGQFDYINTLASQCDSDLLPDWYELLAREAQQARLRNPEYFRSMPLRHTGSTVV
jgi:cation diffusion facilitator CzcD-associated flavoprotein CzcO